VLNDESLTGAPTWARLLPWLTSVMLAYGLTVVWFARRPVAGDPPRELISSVVVLLWCAFPLFLILAGQLTASKTIAAKFALFLSAMVTSGAVVIIHNGPSSHDGALGALFLMILGGAQTAFAAAGVAIAQWLTRSGQRPDNNEMQLTRSAHGQPERGPCS
jgi:hypothetical protein